MKCRYLVIGLLTLALASPSWFVGSALGADKKAAHEGAQISLDQVPAPAKATIEQQAKGGSVQQVTQDTEKGKTVYEAEIVKNGKTRYVAVAEDGKVVKRESSKKEMKEQTRTK